MFAITGLTFHSVIIKRLMLVIIEVNTKKQKNIC